MVWPLSMGSLLEVEFLRKIELLKDCEYISINVKKYKYNYFSDVDRSRNLCGNQFRQLHGEQKQQCLLVYFNDWVKFWCKFEQSYEK